MKKTRFHQTLHIVSILEFHQRFLNHINDIYLNSSEKLKGFGGMCLPKDTNALSKLAELNCPEIKFFKNILDQNEKFKKTVFKGMRL